MAFLQDLYKLSVAWSFDLNILDITDHITTKVSNTMFKGKSLFVLILVMLMAVLLAACGGGGDATQAPADDTTSDDSGSTDDSGDDADASDADGEGVSFGVAAGQMFTATVPDGYSADAAGFLTNGEINVAAVQAPLGGADMDTFVNAAASALGDVETTEVNGRTVLYVTHAGGVTLFVSPDDANVITITATQVTADPADSIDDLLAIAGSIEAQ